MKALLPTDPSGRVAVPPEKRIIRRRFGCLHVLLFILFAVALTVVALIFVYGWHLAPRPFTPVQLNAREEKALQGKLDRLDFTASPPAKPAPVSEKGKDGALEREAYSEEGADRSIRFTEKEVNALLAKNTDLIKESGGDAGFWKGFADGVADVRVEEGLITIKLKE